MVNLLLILIIVSISIVFITHAKKNAKKIEYLKGRFDGWKACEDMAIKRAKEHNYNMDKFLSDILQ